MEYNGKIGDYGTYDAKIEGGVLSVSVGVQYPLKDAAIAVIQKVEDANPGMNAIEKDALEVVKALIAKLP